MSDERDDSTSDPWERLSQRRDVLELCLEEDLPFAERAERLLERLEEEGYDDP